MVGSCSLLDVLQEFVKVLMASILCSGRVGFRTLHNSRRAFRDSRELRAREGEEEEEDEEEQEEEEEKEEELCLDQSTNSLALLRRSLSQAVSRA